MSNKAHPNELVTAIATFVGDQIAREMKGRKYTAQITKIDETSVNVLVIDWTDCTIEIGFCSESPDDSTQFNCGGATPPE